MVHLQYVVGSANANETKQDSQIRLRPLMNEGGEPEFNIGLYDTKNIPPSLEVKWSVSKTLLGARTRMKLNRIAKID